MESNQSNLKFKVGDLVWITGDKFKVVHDDGHYNFPFIGTITEAGEYTHPYDYSASIPEWPYPLGWYKEDLEELTPVEKEIYGSNIK